MSIELNAAQRLAAECLDRPVLVTAGAGSGKTRMLTQRFVNAVLGAPGRWAPADIEQVVAITFTEKAAGEIADRVRLALSAAGRGEAARRVSDSWISTIHGLCARLLRRHAFDAGIDPLFAVADTIGAGRMRERAFESAARSLIAGSQQDGVALFDAYRYEALFAVCVAVTRELEVAGLTADAIALEPTEPVERLLEEARELFAKGMGTCDLGYAGSSSDPLDHSARCEELLSMCGELVTAEREESERLEGLLATLASYKPLKKLKGIEDAAAELAAARESLLGRTAAALVAPYVRALVTLVVEYGDAYASAKADAGVLDFDDLQVKAVRLLTENPDIASRYRELFRVVMIDEFQDTDALQLRLVEALSDGDLCSVGDEKQSIYRFRGADVGVYRAHRERMVSQGALVCELDVNYRSHPELLEFVNAVFGSEEYFGSTLLRLRAPVEAHQGGGVAQGLSGKPRVECIFVDSTDVSGGEARRAEAALVAARLAELRDSGAEAKDMAVLLRRYSNAHEYADALSAVGLRAIVVGGSRFFDLPEIAVMSALVRAAANPLDGLALGRLLASELAPISSDALALMRLGAPERAKRPLWELLNDAAELGLAAPDLEVVERLVRVISAARERTGNLPLSQMLLAAVEEAGWDLRLLSEGNAGRDAFANVLKFCREAATFEQSGGTGPAAFAEYMEEKQRYGDTEAPASLADDGSDAVRIMSIHASKGLEFPIVVVPELAAGAGRGDSGTVRTSRHDDRLAVALKTPSDAAGEPRAASTWFAELSAADADADAEERNRVFYVACTRAQEFLLLSGSMGLQTQKPTSARHDLARLTRVLGVKTPIDGECDVDVAVPASDARCRVRIVSATETTGCASPKSESGSTASVRPSAPLIPTIAGPLLTAPADSTAPQRLSYTQFAEFEQCPKAFWVKRILGAIASEPSDSDGENPLRFGNAIHSALRLVAPDGGAPPAERLQAIGRFHQLSDDEQTRLSEAVMRYCASNAAARANAAQVVRRESPFVMRIDERFWVTGSLDLYARSGDEAFVVDYKSGSTGRPAELAERYGLQAECYALAVVRDGCSHVEIEFVRPEVVDDGGQIQSVRYSFASDDAPRIEAALIERYDRILESTFDPQPSDRCAHCEVPQGLCKYLGRWGAG